MLGRRKKIPNNYKYIARFHFKFQCSHKLVDTIVNQVEGVNGELLQIVTSLICSVRYKKADVDFVSRKCSVNICSDSETEGSCSVLYHFCLLFHSSLPSQILYYSQSCTLRVDARFIGST